MQIAILQGHPDPAGAHLCHALAESYRAGAETAGHDVRTIDVAKIDFPLLRSKHAFEHGDLPNDLRAPQSTIAWADHLVIVYPLWLGEMPALLKAFLEQVLRPSFTGMPGTSGAKPRLMGKTARIVVTMGMPVAVYRWYFAAHGLKNLQRNILSFVGIKQTRSTLLGLVESVGPKRRASWIAKLERLGAAAR